MLSWPGVEAIFETVVRALLIVVILFVFLRLRGKKQLAQFTIFDVIIIIALGSAVGDVMVYPESIAMFFKSVAAIVTVIVFIVVVEKFLANASPGLVELIEGKSSVLVHDGKINHAALKRESITEVELRALLREHNIRSLSEVHSARLEVDGHLSVIRRRKIKNNQ